METTPLSDAMIAKADELNLPHHHNLRVLARQFNDATNGALEDPPTHTPKQLLGAWARARKEWCDFTGEPLI